MFPSRSGRPVLAVALAVLVLVPVAQAQWSPSGHLFTGQNLDSYLRTPVPDGAGGCIVTWRSVSTIYAQRLDRYGVPQWGVGGVVVCSALSGGRLVESMVEDGAGGAVIAWYDTRNGGLDIYAQRVDASGVPQWTTDGEAICQATSTQWRVRVAADGTGNFIFAWEDSRSGPFDIFAQKLNLAGVAQWTFDGRLVCNAANSQTDLVIASDGAGGAYIAWEDDRVSDVETYVQHLDPSGAAQWTANGIRPYNSSTTYDQEKPAIIEDGMGGVVVAWMDDRQDIEGAQDGIYAQRLDSAGNALWSSAGVAACTESGLQYRIHLARDGAGGFLVAWNDLRTGGSGVYANRYSAGGVAMWLEDGVPAGESTSSYIAGLVGTGDGGGIVVTDTAASPTTGEVRARRFDAFGNEVWAPGGIAVATGAAPIDAFVCDDGESVFVIWPDFRGAVDWSSVKGYAQRFDLTHGYWGHPEPALSAVADVANDQGGKVSVTWGASQRDQSYPRLVSEYSIWRATDELSAAAPPPAELLHRAVNPDAPLPRTDYAWELVGTQTAHGWSGYSYAAPTLADSVGASDGSAWYRVAAHDENDPYIAFVSDVLSGYSVDNLAPGAPLLLTANRTGSDVVLAWNRVADGDLRDYAVYRATSAGVQPVPMNFLVAESDTSVIDAGAPQADLYYIVTAYDVHENQSVPSNEASVTGSTGVSGLPEISGLMLLPNRPNPFRTHTELALGLPEKSDVSVEIFDVTGRMVRELNRPGQAPGWVRVPFDGRDRSGRQLANGLYFYKVTAAGQSATGKLVLTR